MPLENGKWRVTRGDCLWNIAQSVYKNPYKWKDIAGANGLSQRGSPIIYPGQLLILPGITSSGGGGVVPPTPPTPPPPPPIEKPRIDWYSLVAGSEREMLVTWSFRGNNFWIRVEQWDDSGHLIMLSENKNQEFSDEARTYIASYKDTPGWNVGRIAIRPVDKDGNTLPNTTWGMQEYDFRNNPPQMPSDPNVEIDINSNIIVTFENIDPNINADSIEVSVYKNDVKYSSSKISINKELNNAKYTGKVSYGGSYTVRARAVRGKAYSGWTNFSSPQLSLPVAPKEITVLRPQIISEQMAKQYGILVEWTPEKTAKQYEVQWTTDPSYFDVSDKVSSKTTEEGGGPRLLIADIEIGHEYFFRVASINDKGRSKNWTPIRSVKMGAKPSAPTTWSNVSSAILGEDLNLYWTHNSTDGSIETFARIHITTINSARPQDEPMEFTKVIRNEKPEGHESDNSVYTINTKDPEWSYLKDGFIIKWKVQTAAITGEYSEWSVEREVNVYAKPTLTIDITNQNGASLSEINVFPFHITVLAKPPTQKPISYYIEIVSNTSYETIDKVGERKVINIGDKVYQKYYDPDHNAWNFIAIMDPSVIDLENNANYTLNVTVAMDSGLSAEATKSFNVYFTDSAYDVYGDIVIDKETLTASIHPYCNEYYQDPSGKLISKLSDNCKLAVYRREYDGSFTLIAEEIDNKANTFVTDPHPSLDYARYRIIARTNDTGAISFVDMPGVIVGEPAVVVQWAEKWSSFDYDASGNGKVEPHWAGSMIKLPYNVDTAERKKIDVSMVEYAGRKHPVSYYGTQVGETTSISVTIPTADKETIYHLRRLSSWADNVYIREPNGTGYWANVNINFDIKHNVVTIPVTLDVTRVEGGV